MQSILDDSKDQEEKASSLSNIEEESEEQGSKDSHEESLGPIQFPRSDNDQ